MRLIRPIFWSTAGLIVIILILTMDRSWLFSMGAVLTIGAVVVNSFFFMNWQKLKYAINVESYKNLQQVDISQETPAPPAMLHSTIQILHDLGFRRLGEEAKLTAEGKELARTWLFVSSDEQVTATLFPARPIRGHAIVQFQALFPGPAWLKTIYPSGFPYGETITLPDFRVRNTRRSLAYAHDLHRAEIAEFTQQHGDPVHIHTMADVHAYGPVFRERHAGRFLQRNLLITRLSWYFVGSLTVLFLIGTALSGTVPELTHLIFALSLGAMFLYLTVMTI